MMLRNLGRKKLPILLASSVGVATLMNWDNKTVEYQSLAFLRSFRAFSTVFSICSDYYVTNQFLSIKEYFSQGSDERKSAIKKECHLRSATKLLNLCSENGGIYIKLGQHISSLVYLVPKEYTTTLSVLQDNCPPSTIAEINEMMKTDLGKQIDEVFIDFDPKPLGIASLAQVHKAKLKGSNLPVAIKFQHPRLDLFTPIDIETVAKLVEWVKKGFPDFEFDWLAKEMKASLPKELNFFLEAENARKVSENFSGSGLLITPKIYWESRRILCMELINGTRIDDLQYMETHKISPKKVSAQLSNAFFEMIFKHGFVHCDPHPGNVFIRWKAKSLFSKFFLPFQPNYDIILLDHGLYRSLTDEFKLDYAHLWISLFDGNEKEIEKYSLRLFTYDERVKEKTNTEIEYHRLFASMLTGRSWEVISSPQATSGLAVDRSEAEMKMIQNKASGKDFIIAISEILSAIPKELLLLLKTNDLLRAVDHALKMDSGTHLLDTLTVMACYCADAVFTYSRKRDNITLLELGESYYVYLRTRFKVFWIRLLLSFM